MANIALIAGSIRKDSGNRAVIATLEHLAKKKDHQTTVLDPGVLPLFSEDLEVDPIPEAVREFAGAVGRADVFIISSPAYNGYPSGVVKNALDWLSRTNADFPDASPLSRPVTATITASPGKSGGDNALPHLRQMVRNSSGRPVEEAQLCLGNALALKGSDGQYHDAEVLTKLESVLDAAVKDISA
ncbi:NADPH-dependent FMN reductase [Haloglycomyces albus]|uniref:NADPH-dependent FMN reductase n=1 Tax=Haloglycomyces albus TaxID=526067 RepID=UPI00046D8854|nr:NADPH-dependent FMN reductase [Haloglycomyces albus]